MSKKKKEGGGCKFLLELFSAALEVDLLSESDD